MGSLADEISQNFYSPAHIENIKDRLSKSQSRRFLKLILRSNDTGFGELASQPRYHTHIHYFVKYTFSLGAHFLHDTKPPENQLVI